MLCRYLKKPGEVQPEFCAHSVLGPSTRRSGSDSHVQAGNLAMGMSGASAGAALRQQIAGIANLVAPGESQAGSQYGGDESTPETASPAEGTSPGSRRSMGLEGGSGTPSARLMQAADALQRDKAGR